MHDVREGENRVSAGIVDSQHHSNVGLELRPVSMCLSPDMEEQVYFLIERTYLSSPARLSNQSGRSSLAPSTL